MSKIQEGMEINMNYIDFIMEKTSQVLAIDSPSGYTDKAADFVINEYKGLGLEPVKTVKGGVLVKICGKDDKNAVLLEAHIDTLGAMVTEVTEKGRLKVAPVGGLNANNAESENVRIITKDNKEYEGTLQLKNASIHVNDEYDDIKRSFDKMEVVIDEKVSSKEEVLKLGIMAGDFVCFNPRTVITKNGFIKSRFLDDKLSVGILLGYAKYLTEENIEPERTIYHHISVYEEVGHGASATVPSGVTELISIDMGCVGEGLECDEYKVSICAKDSRGPYNYQVVSGLIRAAKENDIAFAVDVYPHYGSDADAALTAGHDVRHGLIGAGVYASHGYERSHRDGVENTFNLLKEYLK